MNIIKRNIAKEIESWFFEKKVLIIYGARQVGKTTLVQEILKNYSETLFLSCERPVVKNLLESQNLTQIKSFFADNKIIVLDEAQVIEEIGLILKLLIDTYPDLQIIATGSSSFDLSSKVHEPLTGRNIKFNLYPLSIKELANIFDKFTLTEKLPEFLVYGFYPDVVVTDDLKKKQRKLDEIASDYLFQDVLKFQNLKKPAILDKLLKALAFQVGSEVSYYELAVLLETSSETIERYIDLLEKTFVIFRLSSFSRNLRNELNKKVKIYFYDLGIRNSLIQNYNSLDFRNDIGALWENFLIVEKKKNLAETGENSNLYFWRTHKGQEIDLIEESGGFLNCYEFKWNPKKQAKLPEVFVKAYPNYTFEVINKDNWLEFLG